MVATMSVLFPAYDGRHPGESLFLEGWGLVVETVSEVSPELHIGLQLFL